MCYMIHLYVTKMMKVKFQIMKDTAVLLNIFLKLFQIDTSMVLFLTDVLEKLLDRFLKLFVRKAVVDASVTLYQLIDINIDESSVHLLLADDEIFPIYAILLIF